MMAMHGETLFFPEEIMMNILKCVPVKSLKRFQCVCKQWNNVIKTPSFIHYHSTHHHQTSSLLIKPHFSDDTTSFHLFSFNSNMQFHDFPLPPLVGPLDSLEIVGSCNGLICLVHWGHNYVDPIIWNPSTREIKQLSVSGDGFLRLDYDCDLNSGFEWHFGFGFSHMINDFRMVRMREIDCDISEVGVYSLRDGCWRDIVYDNIKDVYISGQCVTGNGVIFWLGTKIMKDRHIFVIISFDLVTEVFTVIPWPAFTSRVGKPVVYDDKLAIIFYENAMCSGRFSVYFGVMEEGAIDSSGERWSCSEKYISKFDSNLYPKFIWRNQIVSVQFEMRNAKHLYLIDVIANECKRFVIPRFEHSLGSGHYYSASIFDYVESLAPVRYGNRRVLIPKDYHYCAHLQCSYIFGSKVPLIPYQFTLQMILYKT